MAKIEEAQKLRYVTHSERRTKAEGVKEGIKESARQSVREDIYEVLMLRFGIAPEELVTLLTQVVDLQQLEALLRQAVVVGSVEEFEHMAETTLTNTVKAS